MNVTEILSPQEIEEYKQQGYNVEDMQNALDGVSQEQPTALQQSYQRTQSQTNPYSKSSNTLVSGGYNENLIQWQLELDSILERVEHMLRGDKPRYENNVLIWQAPTTHNERVMTDEGVFELMRLLSLYLNRNTILSNYREEVIDSKMYDLGNEIADLIYLKYESFFPVPRFEDCFRELYAEEYKGNYEIVISKNGRYALKTKEQNQFGEIEKVTELPLEIEQQIKLTLHKWSLEKRKVYPMIVRQLVDAVHSAYLRALHGGERESLREARQINQTEALSSGGVTLNNYGQQRKERGLLNPLRILKGEYV